MNTARLLMTAAWLAMAGQAMADDFTIADFSILPGETKTISVELNSANNEYIGFDFYVSLPEGVSILEDEDGNLVAELNSSRCTEDHELYGSRLNDGSYRFVCYSLTYTSFVGTSGDIFTMTVTAAETAEPATGVGTLFRQTLTDADRNRVEFDDFTFNVTIGPEGLLGDANDDGRVNVTDVMLAVSASINGVDSVNINFSNTDVNGDGRINVTDAMLILKISQQ